jgi:hypothetical protein
LLETLKQERLDARLCRLANMRRRLAALEALGITFADINEVLAFLGGDGDAQELLDAPLRFDPSFRPAPTRFSDGSWLVFYGALDWPTAEAEVGYHVRAAAVGAVSTLHYQRLECSLGGDGYDLRPQAGTWPFLTDPDETAAYPQCQSLAREARGNSAQALLTCSSRRAEGVNAPVFSRAALRPRNCRQHRNRCRQLRQSRRAWLTVAKPSGEPIFAVDLHRRSDH